jgi:phosphoribosylformylglycinamidine (FGAM) synthase-like amidotransferase family enzyme
VDGSLSRLGYEGILLSLEGLTTKLDVWRQCNGKAHVRTQITVWAAVNLPICGGFVYGDELGS